jgi:DNA primase
MADEPVLCFDGDAAGIKAAYRAIDTALPLLAPGKSLRFALLPEGSDPDDFIRAEGPEAFRKSLEAARPLVDMLWQREAGAQDLSTPERRAGLEQTLRQAVATIADPSVRKHYEQAVRDRVAAAFGPVRRPRPDRRDFQRQGGRDAGRERWAPGREAPRGPSPSLLANSLVRDRRSLAPTLSDAVLLGALICNPEIAAERLEHLSVVTFRTADLGALADSLGEALSADPDIGREALLARLRASGAAKSLESVLEKLRSAGYSELIEGDPERAAIIWDDAAHLRLRATALSIERQAAALALGRDASEFHLIRLRDIQEQDQRSLRAEGGEAEDAVIVHPFKGQVPGGR